jgi:hypothetical protein
MQMNINVALLLNNRATGTAARAPLESAVNVLIGRGSEEPELGSYESELMLANNEGFATLR